MSRLNPIWTAGRLNEALSAADDTTAIGLTPDGKISTTDIAASLRTSGVLTEAEIASLLAVRGQLRVIVCRPTIGPPEWERFVSETPALLSLLSFNPEQSCRVYVKPGAHAAVGPFLDYQGPLWEWLVRAASKGAVALLAWGRRIWEMHDPQSDPLRMPLPALVHQKRPDAPAWLRAALENFELDDLGSEFSSPDDGVAVAAGLMEMHDLTQSHELLDAR